MAEDDAAGVERTPDPPQYFRNEHGRRVPRSAWFVLGLAAVLVAVWVVVNTGWLNPPPSDGFDVPADRLYAKTLADLGRPDGIRLTSDTPSSSFQVAVPVDSARDKTRLRLAGSAQVAEDSTVFLIVAIDGQQVYQRELPRGQNLVDDTIAIPGQATADGKVRVTVRTRGTLHHEPCTADQSAGMVITLDPGTVVESALDQPVHTLRDAVAAWDDTVTVVLADTTDPWRTTAATLGVALTESGYLVRFTDTVPDDGHRSVILLGPAQRLAETPGWSRTGVDNSIMLGAIDGTPVVSIVEPDADLVTPYLTTPVVSTADRSGADPRAVGVAPPPGEVGLLALGAESGEVQVTENHTWRARFALADLPGGRLPAAARVALQLPAAPPDLVWLLNIDLNGQFLDSRRLAPTRDPVVIPLPPEALLLDNTLTLTVQRDRDLGGCDVRITAYPMQLLGSSGLDLGDAPGAGFTALPRELGARPAVYLSATDPAGTIDVLTAAVPVLAEFLPATAGPEIHWNAPPAPGRPFVVIGAGDPGVGTLVRLTDNRLVSGRDATVLDLPAVETGTVVQCATGNGARGLAVQYAGDTDGLPLPAFGRECVQVITPAGAFTVDGGGAVVPDGASVPE
ncbi:hypothetical protein ACFXK0_08105 [Nocardia sp. NPDC059177]|uniref:hypothetical protein n=1 Tax=Nocardia sp. NPDC059177 TaxID=3346759 RepID=UPI0036BCB11D